jgi:hypothetical protein
MSNKRYRLLMVWNNPFHLDLFETIYESFDSLLSASKAIQAYGTIEHTLYFLEYEYGNTESVILGTFYDGSWPALNDAIEAIKEHEEESEEWIPFKPYEPLPVDEEGNPYFPPDTKGIMVANLEIRNPGEKRLQFIDEEDEDA